MSPAEYERKNSIRKLVDNQAFTDAIDVIKGDMAYNMLNESSEEVREALHREYKALDRIVGQLTAIANEVRAIDG